MTDQLPVPAAWAQAWDRYTKTADTIEDLQNRMRLAKTSFPETEAERTHQAKLAEAETELRQLAAENGAVMRELTAPGVLAALDDWFDDD